MLHPLCNLLVQCITGGVHISRALTLGALCFEVPCVVHVSFLRADRVSAKFVSHAESTKLGKKLNQELIVRIPVASMSDLIAHIKLHDIIRVVKDIALSRIIGCHQCSGNYGCH